MIRRSLAALSVAALSLCAAEARADTESDSSSRASSSNVSTDRPHTVSELGVGALSLPSTNLCIPTNGKCQTSESTFLVGLRNFVKWNRSFGVGAGVSWGFRPVSDDASIHDDGTTIARTHTRNYFMIVGGPRYYFVTQPTFDVWTGVQGGVIVASDRYAVTQDGTSIVGPKALSIATEGGIVGLGFGFNYDIGQNWAVGAWTNEMFWAFPHTLKKAQTNDAATVSGNLFSLETGISVTYRVRL